MTLTEQMDAIASASSVMSFLLIDSTTGEALSAHATWFHAVTAQTWCERSELRSVHIREVPLNREVTGS